MSCASDLGAGWARVPRESTTSAKGKNAQNVTVGWQPGACWGVGSLSRTWLRAEPGAPNLGAKHENAPTDGRAAGGILPSSPPMPKGFKTLGREQ